MQLIGLLFIFCTCFLYQASAESAYHQGLSALQRSKFDLVTNNLHAKFGGSLCPKIFGGPENVWQKEGLKLGTCDECRRAVTIFADIFNNPLTKDLVAQLAAYICDWCKIEDNFVCKYATTEFKDEALYVFQQLIINPNQVCPIMYEDCGQTDYGNPYYNWTDKVKLPDTPKPPVQPLVPPPAGSPTMRVLHISDLHYDFEYKPGTEADCNEPLCCHEGSVNKDGGAIKQPAGYWGSIASCDVPYWTVDAILDYIVKNEQFDYVYWTGDLPSHRIWSQSRENQIDHYENVTALFKKHFGDKLVFSTVGNHESAPVDSYPPHWADLPTKYNIDWLYSELNTSWRNWLSDPETSKSIMRRASYSQKVQNNLRLISINTNYNDDTNYWIFLNQTDPDGVMGWLIEQLQKAEDAGEKVHIIAHEPPSKGGKFWSWKWVYYNIVNRFESTIRGQFMGHEHSDSFRVFFEDADPSKRVIGSVFNTPSVTTYNNHHPGYRLYTIDATPNGTWSVLDYETKLVNLTIANKDPTAPLKPELEYTFNAAFDTKNVFPDELTKLVQKMSSKGGDKYLQRYAKFHRWSMAGSCDEECMNKTLCDIKSCRPKDPNLCKAVTYPPQDGGHIPFGGMAALNLNIAGIGSASKQKTTG